MNFTETAISHSFIKVITYFKNISFFSLKAKTTDRKMFSLIFCSLFCNKVEIKKQKQTTFTLYLSSILAVMTTLCVSTSTRLMKSLSVSRFPCTNCGTGFNGFVIPGSEAYSSTEESQFIC